MRILIAEDDQVLADGLLRALRGAGAVVDHVASGTEADAALLESAVAAALTHVRTADIGQAGCEMVSTAGMGNAVLAELDRLNM